MRAEERTPDLQHHLTHGIGRRAVLRGGIVGGIGLGAAALIGCEDSDDDPETTPAPGGTGTTTPAEPDYVALAREDGSPYPYNYAEPEGAPKPGGTLRFGVSYAIGGSWDTNRTSGIEALTMANFTANRLVGMVSGPELSKYEIKLEPSLARSWETSPDGLTYTFHVQSGVKYQNVPPVDGRAFTAQDVVTAYERERAGGANVSFFALVDSIAAPDDQMVRITMKTPDVDFLTPLASRALPIWPAELYDGQNLLEQQKAIGTGPLIVDEVSKDAFVKLRSNPDYWEGTPHMDGAEWRSMPDAAARDAAFRAGQIEWGFGSTANLAQVQGLESSNAGVLITADPIPLGGTGMMVLNTTSPKLQDVRVRQALLLAMDRDRSVQIIYQGYGKVAPGFPWPFLFDRYPSGDELGPWWRYDPEEAKQLLQAAGAEGLTLEHQWSPAVGGAAARQNNDLMVDFFREIGVTLNLKSIDGVQHTAQYYQHQFIDSGESIHGFSTQAPSGNGYYYDGVYSQSPKNYYTLNDPEIDGWATQQRSELDPETRKELQRRIWDKALANPYRIEFPITYAITVMQPWVRYYRFNGPYIGFHSTYEWGLGFHKAWLDK